MNKVSTLQVVAATCAGAGDENRLHKQIFRLVVIDEATQATEPSTLIPLVRGAESVVMAGDPQQLPPTVISRGAEKAGLQVTVFDRLQRSGMSQLHLSHVSCPLQCLLLVVGAVCSPPPLRGYEKAGVPLTGFYNQSIKQASKQAV